MLKTFQKWIKQFRESNLRPPGQYFISHSYGDAPVRDHLIGRLPPGMKPFVFPPISVRPEEFVSNHLIEAILACDGLIYLEGGNSAKSFWVAFERDFALRSGMPVFAADPNTLSIRRDWSEPLDLVVYLSYTRRDKEAAENITRFLRDERHFNVWMDSTDIPPSVDWVRQIEGQITDAIYRGGYEIVLWSKYSSSSKFIDQEMKSARRSASTVDHDRILFACLDAEPLPASLPREYQALAVQLYGDEVFSDTHRLDDLIVRLYWLIYRNTRRIDLAE
jgi:hypothetical protein